LLQGLKSLEPTLVILQERIGKAFCLPDFKSFPYPFLCVSPSSTEAEKVRAHSRFPSELKQGQLYVGNLVNTMAKGNSQLRLLGIKTVISLTPNDPGEVFENEGFKHFFCQANEKDHPKIDFDDLYDLVL